jgi:protein-L-isoaspartate(D-aspartate) O-methyltransferase
MVERMGRAAGVTERERLAAEAAADATGTRGEADELRGALVDQVIEATARARSLQLAEELPAPVVTALRTVPRHLFTPGAPLARAYENTPVVIETDERSQSLSPVSAPGAVALMLAQLDVRPGESVLEIGSGGYQAALLRELVGPHGSVTTLDIDPDVIARARACLDRAGYGDVRTVCADAEEGAPGGGPFDKIIVGVQAWDIPPAWIRQLVPGGRLVVPLLTRGLTRSWALDRQDGFLMSLSRYPCAFVPMQGAGKHRAWSVTVDEAGVSLRGDEPADVDGAALAGVLAAERSEAWSGVTGREGEHLAGLDLWLETIPGQYILTASQDAVDRGLAPPELKGPTFALADGSSLAYLARPRPLGDERTAFELGACGHGPRGAELAERLAGHIRAWDREHRHGPAPVLTVYPASTPAVDLPPGRVIRKRHTTMVLSWPEAR